MKNKLRARFSSVRRDVVRLNTRELRTSCQLIAIIACTLVRSNRVQANVLAAASVCQTLVDIQTGVAFARAAVSAEARSACAIPTAGRVGALCLQSRAAAAASIWSCNLWHAVARRPFRWLELAFVHIVFAEHTAPAPLGRTSAKTLRLLRALSTVTTSQRTRPMDILVVAEQLDFHQRKYDVVRVQQRKISSKERSPRARRLRTISFINTRASTLRRTTSPGSSTTKGAASTDTLTCVGSTATMRRTRRGWNRRAL